MTRKEMINFILENDKNYNYEKVNFRFYTEQELILICERIKNPENQLQESKDTGAEDESGEGDIQTKMKKKKLRFEN